MTDQTIVQLVLQTGAIGLCALMVFHIGRKLDRLAEAIYTLVQRVEVGLDRDFRMGQ